MDRWPKVTLFESTLGNLRTWHMPVRLARQLEDPETLYNPVAHHWIAHRVYRAVSDEARAAAALNAAEKSYQQRRDAIGDPSLRASFEAIPLHRELSVAVLSS
ncbi:MAG TPA: hypothetical protein VFF63_00765 [Candidatus Babeliales bacterium]|nr:hypothetical protein [Candidatus Babeliales bacterium]